MILEPRFTDDVAGLPTHKFGPSSLTWWGIIGFMVIEGAAFGLAFAAYFFLMGHDQGFFLHHVARFLAWCCVVPALIFAWYAAITYVPMARRALHDRPVAS